MQPTCARDPSDEDLAGRARFDHTAFTELYERHFAGVYAYLRYRVDDRASADDLVATVFTQALDHLDAFAPDRGPFGAWLLGIARNQLRDHRRRRARWRWLPLDWISDRPGHGPAPDAALELEQRREAVLAAVSGLNERERDIIGLKFGAGSSNREIAAITGLSESNIGVIVHRALGRLRKELNREEGRHV